MRNRARDKVVDVEAAATAIAAARADGARIVFTNGCFDLLHVGHLHLIEAARALGDRLVCAVNDDASTHLVKGPGRPLVPFAERALLLAGLEAVDWVVGFAEPTPLALIERLLPDVLVKGDDWPLDAIVGRAAVERAGGQVVRIERVGKHSTSRLLSRLRALHGESR